MGGTRVSSCEWTTRLFISGNMLFIVFSFPKRNSAGIFYFCRRGSRERLSSLETFVLYFYFCCWAFFNLEEGTE